MFRSFGLDCHLTPSNNRAAGPEAFVCAPAPGVCRVREAQARAQAVRKVIVMS
jgi:hypothetical protein